MKRILIQADDTLLQRARRRAQERGISFAQLAREALEKEVGAESPPRPRSVGAFASGRGDLSRRASRGPLPPAGKWR